MNKNQKFLAPPWIAYPHFERYSLGWRMGEGEAYVMTWSEWYDSLNEKEQNEYQLLFPEPITWQGYWQDEDEGIFYQHKEFFVQFWQKHGAYRYSLAQTQEDYAQGVPQTYQMFWKAQPAANGRMTKSCLSQWWKSDFWWMEHCYCCMEQFMMAQKAELFGDEVIKQTILNAEDPRQIQQLGRQVAHFDDTLWNKVKYSIILNGNYLKFTQNPQLREFLLSTGNQILVEASPYDGVWGIKMSATDTGSSNPLKWKGQNLLGFALMEVRDEIRRVWVNARLCETPSL
ncbi:MAG: NADAR family protein [Lachnospiraceae bacterium]|nr:NADAR family protein [Lachnospiraceae bacterium]